MALGEKTGGRQKGSLNRATAEVRELAGKHGPDAIEELARLAKEAANETARIAAIRELLKRAYGDSNSVPIEIELPDTSTPKGTIDALAVIVAAVSRGEITPEAGRDLSAMIETQRRAIETHDIAERLAKLEAERRAAA